MVSLLATAWALPVVCDPSEARRLLDETRVAEDRVPVLAPHLLPALARDAASDETKALLDRLCEAPERLSIAEVDTWETGAWRAALFRMTESRTESCALVQQSALLSVGVRPDEDLVVDVLEVPPPEITPIGDCPAKPAYRDESLLADTDAGVRLFLQTDHAGEVRTARVIARRARSTGWHQQTLLDPAPAHLLGGAGGPLVDLTGGSNPWIVAHHTTREDCTPVGGQTVWRWQEGRWVPGEGREALGWLADRGLWRLAGDAGWFLVVAQDDPTDRALLAARMRKRASLTDDRLTLRESGRFPEMNAGFLFASPAPWPTEAEAEAARLAWPRKTGVYVRQGWEVTPVCPTAGSASSP